MQPTRNPQESRPQSAPEKQQYRDELRFLGAENLTTSAEMDGDYHPAAKFDWLVGIDGKWSVIDTR